MKKQGLQLIIISSIILFLVGCTSSGNASSKETKNQHQSFIYFTETYEDEYSMGDLYIKSDKDSELDKVASDVRNNHFHYDTSLNKIFFLDENDSLYEYMEGKEKKKLAENVSFYTLGLESKYLLYNNADYELYVVRDGEDNEKISSYTRSFYIHGDDLYYLNENNTFKLYNLVDRTEVHIADDVDFFRLFNDKGRLAYITDDGSLYYRDSNKSDPVEVDSDVAYTFHFMLLDDELIYLADDDTLYAANVAKQTEPVKITENVIDFRISDNNVYYVNDDYNLYMRQLKEDHAVKIASDVDFSNMTEPDKIIFEDMDGHVYKINSKNEKIKIAEAPLNYMISAQGHIAYINEDNELYVNDKKIESNVIDFSFDDQLLIYSTADNELYTYRDNKSQLFEDDLTKYSDIYYNNELVYTNNLTFDQIVGIWKTDDGHFIEIEADGTITDLIYDSESQYEIIVNYYKEIYAENDEIDITIQLLDEDELSIDYDDRETLDYSKTTEEAFESYMEIGM